MAYESSDRLTSNFWARIELLDAVAEVKPAVLNDLRELLPRFREASHYLQSRYGLRWDLWEWDITRSRQPEPLVLQLRWALGAWAQNHNLNFDWCIKSAIHSLSMWESDARFSDAGWAYQGHGYVAPIGDEEARFILELPGWRPDLEGQEAFTGRANKAYKQYLQEYITGIKALLDEREQVPRKRKYKPLVKDYDDFKLLAIRLVCRLGYQDILEKVIAAQGKTKRQATYKALESRIRRTAELCLIDPELLKEQVRE